MAWLLFAAAVIAYTAWFVVAQLSLPPEASARYWAGRIEEVGPAAASAELGQFLSGKDRATQHIVAHGFGDALYDTAGLSGFASCDAQFSFGCAHEFTGRLIVDHGFEDLGTLARSCPSGASSTLCAEEIGHGAVAYLGYDQTSLARSLALCDSLADLLRGGCFLGAFEEYDERTMLDAGTPPSPSPSLCDAFSGDEKIACMSALPQR